MLLAGGKNDTGHILHVIVGSESEFYMDIHGAVVIDITPLLVSMNGSPHISLSLTRCKNEVITSKLMDAADIQHLNSFTPAVVKKEAGPDLAKILSSTSVSGASKAETCHPKEKPATPKKNTGRCSYCGKSVPLMDIPGFKICNECVQIELGRRRESADKIIGVVADDV